jgi:hypothetical protein
MHTLQFLFPLAYNSNIIINHKQNIKILICFFLFLLIQMMYLYFIKSILPLISNKLLHFSIYIPLRNIYDVSL